MDENTMNTLITKYLVLGVVSLACLGAGTCAFTTHDQSKASIEVESRKVDEAKAERDRAMFDSMSRAQPPAK